jgi:PPM family protein phosphatase
VSTHQMRATAFGLTHTGRRRAANEDQFLIADLFKSMSVHQTSVGLSHKMQLAGKSQATIMMVADGLGGHNSGERASKLAIESLSTYLLNSMNCFYRCHNLERGNPLDTADEELDDVSDFMVEELRKAVDFSQESLFNESLEVPQSRGMGTTLTLAAVIWPILYVAHVGDSRCYLLRDHELSRLTRDHTMAELAAAAEWQSSAEVSNTTDTIPSYSSSDLWNVIGGGEDFVKPDIHRIPLQPDDKLLLCTDGLTRYVDDGELKEFLLGDKNPKDICRSLVDRANERGGSDNITVVMAKIEPAASVEA